MAKIKFSPDDSGLIKLRITQNYIDRCIDRHIHVLENLLRDEHAPPADGAVIRILDAIDALRNRVVASDDKAGRGLNSEDMES